MLKLRACAPEIAVIVAGQNSDVAMAGVAAWRNAVKLFLQQFDGFVQIERILIPHQQPDA